MGLAVYDGAAGLYIGHIKNLLVSSPGKAGFQLVPDRRACPVASSQKPCLAHLFQALGIACRDRYAIVLRSEEHTSELQSLMRISYAVFCLKKKKNNNTLKHILIKIPH